VHFLDKVVCNAYVRLIHIDPKNGSFEGRIKFYWKLRTAHCKHDRTEPRVRVPGIRATKLVCTVHESRIWRDAVEDSVLTMCWKGVTDITFVGYEIFEVHDFPFDRQLISLDLFEFVWRSHQDANSYDETMKLVSLNMVTLSTLPEWDTFPALITAQELDHLSGGPSYASRFVVRLRIQRKPQYYITQIFLVAFLILLAAILPLGLEAGDKHIGDRLSLHAAGLLTLVAFKYGVSNDLPIVPYGTFTTKYLNLQIITLVSVSVESIGAYRIVTAGGAELQGRVDVAEDFVLIIIIVAWTMYFIFCAVFKSPRPWVEVLKGQMSSEEMSDGGEAQAEAEHNGESDAKEWGGVHKAMELVAHNPVMDALSRSVRSLGQTGEAPEGQLSSRRCEV